MKESTRDTKNLTFISEIECQLCKIKQGTASLTFFPALTLFVRLEYYLYYYI